TGLPGNMAPPAKRPAAAAAAAKKKPAGVSKRTPAKIQLPEGTRLVDLKKQIWRVGRVIGEGGFGLVYLGTGGGGEDGAQPIDCVIKAEPKGNGPLFCEMHFYQRAADGSRVGDWAAAKRLDYVGVPRFYGCGTASHAGQDHRFLAIERLGEDLEKQFDKQRDSLGRVPARRAFAVAVRVLDALEFVHDSGYAHADVKASNLLTSGADRVYLADFGLAFRYSADGRWLKEEKEDPKRRHDGTSEYCSRDAHRGLAPTPRADLENLGWCLLAWLTGDLPWQQYRNENERVQRAKEAAMADLAGFLGRCQFARGSADAEAVAEVLRHAAGLGYHERPQYARLRALLQRRADASADKVDSTTSNGVAKATAKTAAAAASARPKSVAKAPTKSTTPVAKASPRSKTPVAKASPRSKTPVAKASPRSKTPVAKTTPKSTRVAKASPRSTAPVAKASSSNTKSSAVARAAASSNSSSSIVEESVAISDGANGAADAATMARKRKSGCCQTSPHLLKEAKRLARAARK
ncbi:hypothetical protein BOX15_Mlig004277g1, partial [Macrostomum lignano]